MDVRIIPHKTSGAISAWWRIDVRRTVFRFGKFRIWRWTNVGDYTMLDVARKVANEIKSLPEE